jgi:predicted porin
MNKNIKLAVASAVLALSATANAGIIIPAGDWTLDINGNVNAYYNSTKTSGGRVAIPGAGGMVNARDSEGDSRAQGINTGLLPAWIGFTGKTRQNDLDVEFTISLQPGVSANDISGDGAFVTGASASNGSKMLNRQTYLSFGDKSWGSVKLGKDIGVFASDAILNDMTLLGVGGGAGLSGSSANTTNGGIGTGYMYAAWKSQIAYTTPNMNGFQATVAVTNPNQGYDAVNMDRLGLEGKASYSFAANDVTGKVWASGASYDVTTAATTARDAICAAADGTITSPATACGAGLSTIRTHADTNASRSYTASIFDIGATVNVANFGLTGYYYKGEGAGTTLFGLSGATAAGKKRDSDGGYVQATYVLPTKTKVGLAYGVSNLDKASGEVATNLVDSSRRYTVGAYHPLTKHLNLVAEYNDVEQESHLNTIKDTKAKTVSLGAILFF